MSVLPSVDRGNRLLTWIIAACSLALFLPLTWPLVSGRVFVYDDLGHYHVPLRHLYQQALQNGDSLLWTPALFSGFYLHGEGQIGMLHPWHLLLYRILPLQVAFNLEFLASYAAAFGGMYWLLRRLIFVPVAALFGGMLFAFSGFLVMHHPHVNAVAVTVHVPWLLACIDLLITGDRPGERAAGFAGIALVLASALLLGFPQAIWWMFLAASAFVLVRVGETRRWRRLIPCALAIVTGLLLGGIQVLPTLDWTAESARAAVPRSFALSISLHPWNIVQLWSPYVFVDRAYSGIEVLHVHEYAAYSGTLLTLAPLWLWIRRRALTARRTLIVSTAAFAGLMFVLTLGQYGYLGVLLTYLPGVGSLRAPARYIVLVQFALAILAVIAVEDLVTLAGNDGKVDVPALRPADIAGLCSVAVLSVLTTLLLNTHLLHVRADLPVGPVGKAAIGTGIVVAVTIAMLLAGRGVRWGLPLLIVLTAADLGYWGLEYVYRDKPNTIASLSHGLPEVTHARVIVGFEEYWMNRPVLKGYTLIGGYVGLYPNISDVSAFRQHAGARWSIGDDGTLTKLPWTAAPRARLMQEPQTAAVPPGDLGWARIDVDRPGRLVVKTSAPGRRLLATSERFHEGWSATADGKAITRMAVDGFVGCIVEGGEHEVIFRFMPRSFVLGYLTSAAGVILLVLGAIVMMRVGDR
jgi:hypothetical protein